MACAEHFRQIGPNGLNIEKETTLMEVRWPRVASSEGTDVGRRERTVSSMFAGRYASPDIAPMLQMIAEAYCDQGPWPHLLLVFKYVLAHSSSKGRPLCISLPLGRQSPTANDVNNRRVQAVQCIIKKMMKKYLINVCCLMGMVTNWRSLAMIRGCFASLRSFSNRTRRMTLINPAALISENINE